MRKRRLTFTSGEIARATGASGRTVSKWIDSGALKGHRLPCSQDRRVYCEDAIRFLLSHGMDTEARILTSMIPPCVVVASPDQILQEHLLEILPPDLDVAWAQTGFDVGRSATPKPCDVVVIDTALGRSDCLAMGRHLEHKRTRLIAIVAEDEIEIGTFKEAGYAIVFARPFAIADLANAIVAPS